MKTVPKLCDARGKESTTLFFVLISWLTLLIKFLLSGVTLGPLGTMSTMTAWDFASAASAILAIWLGREWTEKRKPGGAPHE